MKLSRFFDFRFFILVVIAMPFLSAWHELGHYLAGKLLGFKAYFFLTSTLTFPSGSLSCLPDCAFFEFIIDLAGPIFSWIAVFAAFFSFLKTKNNKFLIGLSILAPFYYNFIFIVLRLLNINLNIGGGFGISDEVKIAEYLGVPALVVSGLIVAVGAVILYRSLQKLRQKDRLPLIIASISGVLAAYLFFWIVLQPFITPSTEEIIQILYE